jgi:hypothetical protein
MRKLPMTAAGYLALENELKHRIRIERPRLIQRIQEAIADDSNLAENSEYQSAKTEQEINEARIAELEDKLARADIIDVSKLSGDIIKFGATVTLIDRDTSCTVVSFQKPRRLSRFFRARFRAPYHDRGYRPPPTPKYFCAAGTSALRSANELSCKNATAPMVQDGRARLVQWRCRAIAPKRTRRLAGSCLAKLGRAPATAGWAVAERRRAKPRRSGTPSCFSAHRGRPK